MFFKPFSVINTSALWMKTTTELNCCLSFNHTAINNILNNKCRYYDHTNKQEKNCKIDQKKTGLSKIFLEIFFFLKSKWLQGVCELKILYTMPGTGKRKKIIKKSSYTQSHLLKRFNP